MQEILLIKNDFYMSVKKASEFWGIDKTKITEYCRSKRIPASKISGCWYISVKTERPLTEDEIYLLLINTLKLKNNPKLTLEHYFGNADAEQLIAVYGQLAALGYTEPAKNIKPSEIPRKVVLTEKAFDMISAARPSIKKIDIKQLMITLPQIAASMITIANSLNIG